MRHVKSNINILKLNNRINLRIKSKSIRNFKKSTSTLHINDPNLNAKGISYNLLTKKACKISIIPIKYFNNYKGKNNQNRIYYLNGKCKAYKSNYNSQTIFNNNSNNTRSISIRLNFKNKIINNYFMKRYKINNSKSNIKNKLKNTNNNLNERIKEKDKQIALLQRDLLQSQKLLSQLQEEKQKEISSKYSTIKYEDNHINNAINSTGHGGIIRYSSLSDFFAMNSGKTLNVNMLKTVYGRRKKLSSNKSMPNSKKNIFGKRRKNKSKNNKIKSNLNIIINTSTINKFHLFNNSSSSTNKNCKTRNSNHKNYQKDNNYYGAISNTKRKHKKNSSPIFMRFSSSSPNKFVNKFTHQYDCKSKTVKNSLKKKVSSNDFKKNYNNKKDSPYKTQNTVNYKSIKNISNKNNDDNICSKSEELIDMMNKGEDLIERTKSMLHYLIILNDKIKELKEKK